VHTAPIVARVTTLRARRPNLSMPLVIFVTPLWT
jgi:hypothetical protein